MIVKIDNREDNRHCKAVTYFKKNHKIIIEEIPIRDFIFIDDNISVVFEYKTFNDFKNSVKEGRIFDQTLKQYENFKYYFIIIELGKSKNELYSSTKYFEAIASLNTFTTVIICPTLTTALRMMEKQAEFCIEQHPLTKKPNCKIDNVAFNYLLLVNGITKIKAHTICKNLNLKTLDDLKKINTKKLSKVPGIGSITAQRIITGIKLT